MPLGSRHLLLKRFAARFAGANPDRFIDGGNEDLPVADLARLSHFDDRGNSRLHLGVLDNKFDLNLRDEIDPILSAAIHFGMAFLPAETANLGDGHARSALFE